MDINPKHVQKVGKGLVLVVKFGKRLDELLKQNLTEAERGELFELIRTRPDKLTKRKRQRIAELLRKGLGGPDGLGGLGGAVAA